MIGSRGVLGLLVAVVLLAATVALAPRGGSRATVSASASPVPAAESTDGLPHDRRTPAAGRGPDALAHGLTRGVVQRSTTIAEKNLSYCANGTIDDPPPEVRRVVFVVHGNDRRPCGVAGAVLAGATDAQRRQTLVVAPRFATAEDTKDRSAELYWTFYGWSQGDESVSPGGRISSYAVLDELIRRVGNRSVVVAGFSGGGQFVNRFAAGSASQPDRFVIANPSSYLYFSPARPGTTAEDLTRCPGYNDYRYGLNQLNPYMAATGGKGLTERYGKRSIVYLLGDRDRDPRSSSMDKSCGANLEGPNRLERGQRYWAYLASVFGPDIGTRQQLHLVPGVAHDPVGMFTADAASTALLD